MGSEIRDPEKIFSRSRIQGSKRRRILDPDPQHCFVAVLWIRIRQGPQLLVGSRIEINVSNPTK
jgi:hypothetical protein